MAHRRAFKISILLLAIVPLLTIAHTARTESTEQEMKFIQIAAKDKHERSQIVNQGVSIEFVRSDSVWGIANDKTIKKLKKAGFTVMGTHDLSVARGGHQGILDFPRDDARYHNYQRTQAALQTMQAANADIASLVVIGPSLEGRNITAIHINTTPEAHTGSHQSNKPGAVFMGNHHAREHLSVEIPLMMADYLLRNRAEPRIAALLDTRDIWIIPMVNPDGSEWDVSTGRYKFWRKNRRNNGNGTFGVDLNRNYGFQWGTGGSSTDGSSDVYMGPQPFSEPETQAIRNFVDNHLNTKVLLSFHTFSELILYPWGHSNDPVPNATDRATFQRMAQTMAQWNHYTPEQSSDLYIASGDTTDWAYGTHGIFAFTFELSPSNMFDGGFYPGDIIDRVFADNLQPVLYMIDVADNPRKVLKEPVAMHWGTSFTDLR
jgi:carboxypeptidase T